MKTFLRRTPLLALGATLALSACVGDGDELTSTLPPAAVGGDLFARYVALGNSITAGYQSNAIRDSTQTRSYPVFLAAKAQASFNVPRVTGTGCPRYFIGPFRPDTIQSVPGGPCVRLTDPTFVQNLAVPGERIADLVRFPTAPQLQSLNTLLIGPRTQANAMIASAPTFVSVWIGNNDALEATVGGLLGPTPTRADSSLTPLSAFQASLNALVDSIKVANPQGAMLIGVVDAIDAAPIVQPGAYFFLAAQSTAGRFQGKLVNANCSPLTATGQPNPLSRNFVSFQIVSSAIPEISCDPAQAAGGGAFLLDAAEIATIKARIAAYNSLIEAAATANNWLYVNPNTILAQYLPTRNPANTGPFTRLRKCQLLASANTAALLQAAVQLSCPAPTSTVVGAPIQLGTLMSFDGVHPSTEAHQVIAEHFARAINAKYGTALPANPPAS
ncbi:MAG TPA: SGNH/GDSL hydrolase family protein [Longimicrobium sp.]|jgi:hypothetical protein